MKQSRLYTLEEVYQYATRLGYAREDVSIDESLGYDYDKDMSYVLGYEVSFGHECTEVWSWYFEDLGQPAVDYDHLVWED